MEGLIVLDSSVLIEYFRKKNKDQTLFYQLSGKYEGYIIRAIVHFEILIGSTPSQEIYWADLFNDFILLNYSPSLNYTAINISRELKRKRKKIEFKDLIIAATAFHYDHPLATLNKKHFSDISSLQLITPDSI